MSESRKPIAEVLVLAGPTHYMKYSDDRREEARGGKRIKFFTNDDLDVALATIPESQRRVRLFPRIEDAAPAAPVTVDQVESEPEPAKERRRK